MKLHLGPLTPKRSLASRLTLARPDLNFGAGELRSLDLIRKITRDKEALVEFVESYRGSREQFSSILEQCGSFLERASKGLITENEFAQMLPTDRERLTWQRYQEQGWRIGFLSAAESRIGVVGFARVDQDKKTLFFSLSLYPEHPSRVFARALGYLQQLAPVPLGRPAPDPYAHLRPSVEGIRMQDVIRLTPPAVYELKMEYADLPASMRAAFKPGRDLSEAEARSLAAYVSNPYIATAPYETGRELMEKLGVSRSDTEFAFLDLNENLLAAVRALGGYNREHNSALGVEEICGLVEKLLPHKEQEWIIYTALTALEGSNAPQKLARVVRALVNSPSKELFQLGPINDEPFFRLLMESVKYPLLERPDPEMLAGFCQEWMGRWQAASVGRKKQGDAHSLFVARLKAQHIAQGAREYFMGIGDMVRADLFTKER